MILYSPPKKRGVKTKKKDGAVMAKNKEFISTININKTSDPIMSEEVYNDVLDKYLLTGTFDSSFATKEENNAYAFMVSKKIINIKENNTSYVAEEPEKEEVKTRGSRAA